MTIHFTSYGGQKALCCGVPIGDLPAPSSTTSFSVLADCPGPQEKDYIGEWIRFGSTLHIVKEMSVAGRSRNGPSLHLVTDCGKRLTTNSFHTLLDTEMQFCDTCLNDGDL